MHCQTAFNSNTPCSLATTTSSIGYTIILLIIVIRERQRLSLGHVLCTGPIVAIHPIHVWNGAHTLLPQSLRFRAIPNYSRPTQEPREPIGMRCPEKLLVLLVVVVCCFIAPCSLVSSIFCFPGALRAFLRGVLASVSYPPGATKIKVLLPATSLFSLFSYYYF